MFRQCFLFAFCVFVVPAEITGYAQHPGAYSSPQYAKKMAQYTQKLNYPEREYQKIPPYKSKHEDLEMSEYSNLNAFGNVTDQTDQGYHSMENNEIVQLNKSETQSGRSSGFMETAGNFLNGKGGQMLADIAREVISRSTGASSQVLSLNLTNLVILVVLKALILAASMFGAGAWNQGHGRSLESNMNSQWVSGAELDLWANYLKGQPGCLSRAACLNPGLAKRYSSGADVALTTAKLMNNIIPYDEKYEKILNDVKEAAAWGASGMQCESRYQC